MKRNGKQWLLGKTFDSFCPLGPALVTTDAVTGETERGATAGSEGLKGRIKDDLVTHAIICDFVRQQLHRVNKLQFTEEVFL